MSSGISRSHVTFPFLVLGFLFLLTFYINNEEGLRMQPSRLWHGATSVGNSKPNAVIVMLVSLSRINQALVALRNIEDRFNRRLKYPYVLLTEANITEEVHGKVRWITEGRAKFADLPSDMWGPPAFLDPERIKVSLQTIGFTLGYRSMCRFFSGFFWRHPAIAKYDWIWLLDSDIKFHCDVVRDTRVDLSGFTLVFDLGLEAVRSFHKDAGCKCVISPDTPFVQPSLPSNVSSFLASRSHLIPEGVNHAFQWHNVNKALRGEAGVNDWTLMNFYNNWEISHRNLWTSPVYTAFFEYLDKIGGFFYERWGDAPVHSFGVSLSLRPEQVIAFTDMGYEHQEWPYECPAIEQCTCVRDAVRAAFDNGSSRWFNSSGLRGNSEKEEDLWIADVVKAAKDLLQVHLDEILMVPSVELLSADDE
ncbi:glycosyltransferase family 15 protein [Sphaerobolus stellatus SS14]|nr:glycosyltransferase family 15 protein [Sphaerobolus stellatus SS14]